MRRLVIPKDGEWRFKSSAIGWPRNHGGENDMYVIDDFGGTPGIAAISTGYNQKKRGVPIMLDKKDRKRGEDIQWDIAFRERTSGLEMIRAVCRETGANYSSAARNGNPPASARYPAAIVRRCENPSVNAP